MAEQVRGQGGSAGGEVGAERRAAAIEARVAKLIEAQARGRRQMLVIAALVLVMFGVFALLTARQLKENLGEDRLREAVIARAPDVQPELEQHLNDVARDVMPVYRDLAVERFKAVGPEVAQAAMDRLKTLPADASKQIEAQVQTSRDRVLPRIEPELARRYPSLTDARKKELLATHFHDKIDAENEQLASKMNAIRTSESIRMDAALEKFGVGDEPPPTQPRERERQFLHALVDVLMDSDLGAPITPPAPQGTGQATARLVSAGPGDLGDAPDPAAASTAPATTEPTTTSTTTPAAAPAQ